MSANGYGFGQFLKTATNAFIDDAETMVNVVTAPVRIVGNHIYSVVSDLETSSQMRVQRSLNRAQIYQTFLHYKNHFSSSPDRSGKYVYYFLCGVESLPPEQSEAMIQRVTMYLDADPDAAILQISTSMQKLSETNLLKLEQRQMLELGI